MATVSSPLSVNTGFDPQTGTAVSVTEGIERVTAPNSSAYTFTGTNSFIIGTGQDVAVLDPGPKNATHLAALKNALRGRTVKAILLTHTHLDHSALARSMADELGAPLWFGGKHCLSRPRRFLEVNPLVLSCDWDLYPDRVLVDGDELTFGEITLSAIETPGHCANHLAFGVSGMPFLFSGDHVMGWSSTLVAVPDGSMADYFRSLDKLLALSYTHYLPAHGGPIVDGKAYTEQLRAHRRSRNNQVLEALTGGPHSVKSLVGLIYTDLPIANRFAAAMTLRAHLEYLTEAKKVVSHWWPGGRRYSII